MELTMWKGATEGYVLHMGRSTASTLSSRRGASKRRSVEGQLLSSTGATYAPGTGRRSVAPSAHAGAGAAVETQPPSRAGGG